MTGARLWPAGMAAALVAAVILAPLGAVAVRGGGLARLGPADLSALGFTLWQAAVSAGLSCLIAVPLARALHRRRFPGRTALITALGAPFILPTVVAVMGLIAVFGRRGLVNTGLEAAGLPAVSIYGAQGVILAHVFFNLPLATRMVFQGWQAIPAERLRLAASLGLGPGAVQRHLEVPMLRAVLPGAFLAIFLVCLGSFAVALILGGGPRATTLELAIYQAFRFDFDLGRAATLGLTQVALTLAALALTRAVARGPGFGAGLDRAPVAGFGASALLRGLDALLILSAAAFLLVPIAVLALRGLPALPELPPLIWRAAANSLIVAAVSTLLTLALALPLALAAPHARWAEAAGMLPLAASGLVLGTGLFLIARPFVAPAALALPLTVVLNAVLGLPFVLRLLIPEVQSLAADYDRLCASLDLRGWARLRRVTLPRLARPLGFGAGLAAAFSMGDLGVIALFGTGERITLPLALYQLMGAYRLDQAAAAACLLMALSFGLFALLDRIGHHAQPR